MIQKDWKTQYKQWKKLKPYEIKLIDDVLEAPTLIKLTYFINYCLGAARKLIK